MDEYPVRVFVIEDEEKPLLAIADWLTLSGFEVETFLVQQTEASLEELRDRLRRGWWHVIISDIVLRPIFGPEDITGIRKIRETDPIIPKIMWTNYPRQNWDDLRSAAVAIIEKNDRLDSPETSGSDALVRKIKQLLQSPDSPYRLNLDLEIREDGWLPKSRLTRLQAPNQQQAEARLELEDLLRKLFFDYQTLDLGRSTDLPDGTALIRGRGQTKGGMWASVVVHFGLRDTMRQIESSYNAFLRFTGNAANRLDTRETRHYGGAVYRLEGEPEAYRPLSSDFSRLTPEAVDQIIDNLFDRILRPLYATRAILPGDEPFDARYRRALGLEERMSAVFRGYMERLLDAHPLVHASRGRAFYLHADDLLPGTALAGQDKLHLPDVDQVVFDSESLFRLEPAPESVIYGALDVGALFYDPAGRICLPPSAATARGFLLHDLIALEAAVMLQLVVAPGQDRPTDDPALLHVLQVWLEPNEVAQRFRPSATLDNSSYGAALAAAAKLRRVAGRLGEVDMRYYYGGLLFHAARLVMEARKQLGPGYTPGSLHAALAAALLAARLQAWPNLPWTHPDARPGDELALDEENGRMYVPECGQWISLAPQQLRLMRLLKLKAWQVVSDNEISEALFGRPDGGVQNLVGQVRRLIRDCAGGDIDVAYIKRERNQGYILRPNRAERPD